MNRRDVLRTSLGTMLLSSQPPPQRTILVPAYFYPDGDRLKEWNRLIASARKAPIVAIANPASGPGEAVDPNYTAVLAKASKAGIDLVGYVSTRYAKRSAEAIVADMERWRRFYPQVRGFFLDEQASDAANVRFYEDLAIKARRILPGGQIAANPGTTCEKAYVARNTSDVVALFEGPAPGFTDFKAPGWAGDVPPSRFAAIVYDVPSPDAMRRVLRESRTKGFGVVYVTDARGENPYDRLPTYWEDEVKFIASSDRP
jgi:catechol 2,3-dioxygenase-like lactoylglutathione lyase family enzyme